MTDAQTINNEAPKLPLLKSLQLGIKVLVSELHWNIIKGLRTWEIKQMNSRLLREYQRLGQLVVQQDKNPEQEGLEKNLEEAKSQVEFLEGELAFLKNDLAKVREDMLKKRTENWGI